MSYIKFCFSGYQFKPKFENVLEAIENFKRTRLESYGKYDYAFIGEDIPLRSMNNGRWIEDAKRSEYARRWCELLICECEITEDKVESLLNSVSLGFVCLDNFYESEDKSSLKLFFEGNNLTPTIRHVEESIENVYQREVMGGLHIGKSKYNTTWITKQEDGTWIDRDEKVWVSLFIAEMDENWNIVYKVNIGLTRLYPKVHAQWF
jgi:hypothetical protein